MDDMLHSEKQWTALLKRLDTINDYLTTLKIKSDPETRYLDNLDMMKLLQVTVRTLQRWRKSGLLPSNNIGGKHYYKANRLLDDLTVNRTEGLAEESLPCACPGFDPDEVSVLSEHNSDFTARLIVEELIVTWMQKVTREDWDNRNKLLVGPTFRAMTATQIADFLVARTKFNMTDHVLIQIGKIMNKMGFEHVKKANISCYLVHIFDAPTVEIRLYSSEYPGAILNVQNQNNLNIKPEDNFPNLSDDGLLPF
jgi:hypothetical protein